VESAAAIFNIGDKLAPDSALEHGACFDRQVDKAGSLGKHAAAADCVVADFRVAHVVVGRQAYRCTVRFQLGDGAACLELSEVQHVSSLHRITLFIFAISDAVHDNEDERPSPALPLRILFQSCNH